MSLESKAGVLSQLFDLTRQKSSRGENGQSESLWLIMLVGVLDSKPAPRCC